MNAPAGKAYSYQVKAIRSIGDLRRRDNARPKPGTKFWKIERLTFSLTQKPGWMSINADTGLITGTSDGTGGTVIVSVTLTKEHRLVHDKNNITWGNEYEQSKTYETLGPVTQQFIVSGDNDAAGQSNEMLPPLMDLGPGQTYKGEEGGLYPGGSNVRPAAHDAAGRKIARDIVPLDADGNPDPVNGKIVFILVSVSNAYGAWHLGDAGDTSTTFMTRADANPAKNPKLIIAYGFEYQLPGGNRGTGDPGPDSIFYRTLDHALQQQGLNRKQVQIVWLFMPVSGKSWGINLPPEDRTFPADARESKHAWKEIVHAIHTRYPNVKIIYSSTKGAMYMSELGNPEWIGGPIEPWNHDAAWGVKWVIEDQINGAADLNYDPARGPVKSPWLSWGPYFWSYPDGAPRHYDGFVWTRADVASDGLHPSLSGLTKYATLFLHQMTTDPTATPWFVKPGSPANQPPEVAKAASAAAYLVSGMTTVLSVLGADDGGEPNLTYTWSYSGPADVTFSANGPNRAKDTTVTFRSPGRYTFRVMIADAGGLTATSSIEVTVVWP